MWYYTSPAIVFGELIGVIIVLVIAGFIFSAVSAIALAPGIIITANLMNLVPNQLTVKHLWISSISFSVLSAGGIWFKWRNRFMMRYALTAVVLSMIVGLYTCYIAPNNGVVATFDRMYNSSFSSIPTAAIISGDNVNLRSSPSADAGVIGVLNRNDSVLIKKELGNWCFIQNNSTGKTGWVSKQYVTLNTGK